MAVFISLGRQRLPFIKCALVVDVDQKNVQENLETFKKNKIHITKFACYTNEKYKYFWTAYFYIGKDDNFAKAIQTMQDRVLICGFLDYTNETERMMVDMALKVTNSKIKEYKLKT